MPELPEVETVRRTLAPLLGATVMGIWTSGKPLRLNRPVPKKALARLVGSKVTALRRLGKYLLIDTDGDAGVLVHLGMSGRLRLQPASEPRVLHTHVVLQLDGGRELRYSDPRRFGQVDVFATGQERAHVSIAALGPDPIAESVSGDYLWTRSRKRTTSLKAMLLDQEVLAGVGNIYASEALWQAKIKPTRKAKTLTREQADLLATAVHDVLEHALTNGGTTLRDFVNSDGKSGEHADYLSVYDRDGQPCPRCGTTIKKSVQQGRATYFCRRCQT